MTIQTYEDGTEMTVGMLAGAVAVGAIGALAITLVKEKMHNRRWKKYYEKIDARTQAVLENL